MPEYEIRDLNGHSEEARRLGAQRFLQVIQELEEGREIFAQAALWLETQHLLDGKSVGFIGAFSALDEDSAREVLQTAEDKLSMAGAEWAVGPIDGSTWRSYRFLTGSEGNIPPFLMEPANPDWYPKVWESAGYKPVAEYYSSFVTDLRHRDEQVVRAAERLAAAGVTFEPLNLERWEAELAEIHELSLIAFTPNFLYEPLPLEHFAASYAKARALVKPELVLLARQEGKLVGYCFCLPNPYLASSVIVKTLAVLPGRGLAGLGAVLLEEVQHRAADLGFASAIHALMHENNRSRNLSMRYGKPFRTYALYGKEL